MLHGIASAKLGVGERDGHSQSILASPFARQTTRRLGSWGNRVLLHAARVKSIQELPTNQLGVPEASLRKSVTFLERKFKLSKDPVTSTCKGWHLMAFAVGAKEVPKMGPSKQMRR